MHQEKLHEVKSRIENKETFVLNMTARWCPDCVEKQIVHLPEFETGLSNSDLELVNLEVQREKRVFLSKEHELFVESLGGHGYPRTVLFIAGTAKDADNVEFVSAEQLKELSERFLSQL